ncbi:hypothetical protein YC2023_088354 [Brassica napus]
MLSHLHVLVRYDQAYQKGHLEYDMDKKTENNQIPSALIEPIRTQKHVNPAHSQLMASTSFIS